MTLRLPLLFTLFCLCFSTASAFGAPSWGRAQNDMQLGIEWGSESNQSGSVVRISMKNVGSHKREITIGIDGSAGPVYDVKIVAVGSHEMDEYVAFDLNALKMEGTPFPLSKSVILEPGATYVFAYPVRQLICVVDRKDTPLEDLLKQGYSVRASFETVVIQDQTPELAPINK